MSQEVQPIKERLRAYSASKTNPNSGSKEKPVNAEIKEGIREGDIERENRNYKKAGSKEEEILQTGDMAGKEPTLESLQNLLQGLTNTVTSIKQDIKDLKGNTTKLTNLESNFEEEKIKTSSDSLKIKLLSATVIKQEQMIKDLNRRVDFLTKELKKPNLFIDGILEDKKEETSEERVAKVSEFFKQKMEIEEEVKIKQAFRVGMKNPRTFKVVLENPEDKQQIFSNVSNLKGKQNARKKLFFVNDDLMDEEKEVKEYYRDLLRENTNREESKKWQIKLRKGKIFINNQKVTPKVEIPAAADILTLEEGELDSIHGIKTHESGQHQESDSEFYSHYMRIVNEKDVEAGLAKMKIKYGDSTHIVTAYRMENSEGPYRQGYVDDGESGAGRSMLKKMQEKEVHNLAVFVIRYYGGKQMGVRRFEVYANLTEKAVNAFKIRLDKLRRANRLRRSGSQLSQLSMDSMDMQDHHDQNDEEDQTQSTETHPA